VLTTVLSLVRITETVLSPIFATYAYSPAGFTATPIGLDIPATVAVTKSVAVSITETLLEEKFAM